MERAKIDFQPMKNKIIKVGKNKIEIKPFISAMDLQVATKLCLDTFFKNFDDPKERFELFPQVRIAFDTIVIDRCTNIDYDGVKYDDIVGAGIMDIVRNNIFNYCEAFELVLESLRLRNVQVSLTQVADTLPSEEGMTKSLKAIVGLIDEFEKKDPDKFKDLVKAVALTEAQKATKNEFAKDKAELKNKKLAETKKAKSASKKK